ncbi:hypothetical protein [Paeniglutamicibacter sp.]|uniref:hypothetical protein n=1 Tax=Paeniglutamicibacter sp. TaxID=1934391 RepID=UPI00398A1E1E
MDPETATNVISVAGLANSGIAALSGLAGATIGGVVASLTARATAARQWNKDSLESTRTFYVEMIETINAQWMALNESTRELEGTYDRVKKAVQGAAQIGDRVDFRHERSPANQQRVKEATAVFRSLLAKAVLYGGSDINDQLTELDSVRSDLTEALNIGDLSAAKHQSEVMGMFLPPLYRATQRGMATHNLVIVNTIAPRRGRKQNRAEILETIAKIDRRDAEDAESLTAVKSAWKLLVTPAPDTAPDKVPAGTRR